MRYVSVCSGIEAATVAWHSLGWAAAAYSEIDPFARALLAVHYPDVPCHGDFTTIRGDEYGPVDVLVGGTPCQDFSIAGLRAGIAGERGNLTLQFLQLVSRMEPRWIVWENVPGVLSSDNGRAFGAFLGGLAQLGYGFAYRVLDAQYFNLAQRRARVFVIGYLGDWRRAAAVLFERESLRGCAPPSRETGQAVGPTLTCRTQGGGGLGTDADCDGGLIPSWPAQVVSTLNAHFGDKQGLEDQHALNGASMFVPHAFNWQSGGDARGLDLTETTSELSRQQTPAVAIDLRNFAVDDVAHTMQSSGKVEAGVSLNAIPAVAFDLRGREGGSQFEGPHDTANLRAASGGSSRSYIADSAVRRLTPLECERLQGFPDNYTNIPWRGKNGAPDGRRYKALGNSMAVPVMRWIGQRIQWVEGL